jgi:16S rRNA (uracil1498-N3)-methyltransferase
MALRRFFIPPESVHDDMAVLPAAEARHLRNVLRLRFGETVEVFDGTGRGYTGVVEFHGADVHILGLVKLPSREPAVRLTVAAALVKPARFEWMLEKATELGVCEIIPLRTRFSEVSFPDIKISSRRDRWERIVTEASKQCGRFTVPRVRPPIDFDPFIAAEEFSRYSRILFYEKSSDLWRPETDPHLEQTILCIGPEGGWEDREIVRATAAGFAIHGLGPLTLRAETAVIAAVSIFRHHVHLKICL